MAEIQLSNGMVAIVDDDISDFLSMFEWVAQPSHNTYYAIVRLNRKRLGMHNLIMHSWYVDHVDGNGLNNQRVNLRSATHQQNMMNKPVRRDSVTGFKGVGLRRHISGKHGGKPFRALITLNGRTFRLGQFDTAEEAARAYDVKAQELFGEFARLNFPFDPVERKNK